MAKIDTGICTGTALECVAHRLKWGDDTLQQQQVQALLDEMDRYS